MHILATILAAFGPPPAIEAAVTLEPNCAGNVGNAMAVLQARGVEAHKETIMIDGQLHAFVISGEWVIDNGRLCPGRVCLARDALYGLKR